MKSNQHTTPARAAVSLLLAAILLLQPLGAHAQDSTAPTVTFDPDGTGTVTNNAINVTLTFSEPIKNSGGGDIDSRYIRSNVTFVNSSSANISFTGSIDGARRAITIYPRASLPDETYTVTLPANTVHDDAENAITSDQAVTFIVDGAPIASFNSNQTGYTNATPAIVINFSEDIKNRNGDDVTNLNAGNLVTLKSDDGSAGGTGDDLATNSNTTINTDKTAITIQPTVDLVEGNYVMVVNNFEDARGHEETTGYTFRFGIVTRAPEFDAILITTAPFAGGDTYINKAEKDSTAEIIQNTIPTQFSQYSLVATSFLASDVACDDNTVTTKFDNGEGSSTIPTVVSVTADNADGIYWVCVSVLDLVFGLSDIVSSPTFTIDTTDPSFSYIAPSSLTVASAISTLSPTITEVNKKSTEGYTLQTVNSLPPGLLLNTDTGAITGTPTTVNAQTQETIIVVTDAAGNTGEHPIIFPAVDAASASPDTTAPRASARNGDILDNTADVIFTFNEPIKNNSGGAITPSYIENNVTFVNNSGDAIPFTGSISSNRQIITIDPDTNLPDEIYTVSIPANTFQDDSGNFHAGKTDIFTKDGAPVATFDHDMGGYTTTTPAIVINFNEAIKNRNGNGADVTDSNAGDLVTLQLDDGNGVGTGTDLATNSNTTINAAKTAITIQPTLTEDDYVLTVNDFEDDLGREETAGYTFLFGIIRGVFTPDLVLTTAAPFANGDIYISDTEKDSTEKIILQPAIVQTSTHSRVLIEYLVSDVACTAAAVTTKFDDSKGEYYDVPTVDSITTDGTYRVCALVTDAPFGLKKMFSSPEFIRDTTAPAFTLSLKPSTDTGIQGDTITNSANPILIFGGLSGVDASTGVDLEASFLYKHADILGALEGSLADISGAENGAEISLSTATDLIKSTVDNYAKSDPPIIASGDGTIQIAVKATDSAGNTREIGDFLQRTSSFTITLDTTDPSFSYTAPSSLMVASAISTMSPTLVEKNRRSTGGYALQTGNTLPPGLDLDADNGEITGTPTAVNSQTHPTIIVVTDAAGNTGEHTITFPSVDVASGAPGVPQNFVATAGDTAITLSWRAPTSNGVTAITKYRYIQKIGTNAYSTYADVPGSDGSTTSHTFTSLTNGVAYGFKICAHNSVGCGTETREQTATPQLPDTTAPTVTFTPTDSTATNSNTIAITLTFNEAVRKKGGAPIILHTDVKSFVTFLNESDDPVIFTGSISSDKDVVTLTPDNPLPDGTYTATLLADKVEDAVGNTVTTEQSMSFIVDTKSPTILFLPANGDVTKNPSTNITLTFSEPVKKADGTFITTDTDIKSFVNLTDSSNNTVSFVGSINSEKTVITLNPSANLRNGTYTIVLTANQITDNAGNAFTATANPSFTVNTTAAITSVPLSFAATAGDGEVTLSWKPPSIRGGAPSVVKYQYQKKVDSGVYGTWTDIPVAIQHSQSADLNLANITAVYVKPDGSTVIVGSEGGLVRGYPLTSPNDLFTVDISTATAAGTNALNVRAATGGAAHPNAQVSGLYFNADGTRMEIFDTSTQNSRMYAYGGAGTVPASGGGPPVNPLTGAQKWKPKNYLWHDDDGPGMSQYTLTGKGRQSKRFFINLESTKLYLIGGKENKILHYTILANWIGTGRIAAEQSGMQRFPQQGQTQVPKGLWLSGDGSTMFVLGDNNIVYRYTLSSAWTLPGTLTETFGVSTQIGSNTVSGLSFNGDGTIMYIVQKEGAATDNTHGKVHTYTLPTPWAFTKRVTPHIVDGLENGVSYTFKIRAVDSSGAESNTREIRATPAPPVPPDTTPPHAPTLDLEAASDTGDDTDNITSDNTPDITVSGLSGDDAGSTGADVTITATHTDGTLILKTRKGNGTVSFAFPKSLKDGTWTLTATAVDSSGNKSVRSEMLEIAVYTERLAATVETIPGGYLNDEEDEHSVVVSGAIPGDVRLQSTVDVTVRGDNTVNKNAVPVSYTYTVREEIDSPPTSNANPNFFGQSIATYGDLLVVGAPLEDEGRGSVYLYKDTDHDGWWSDETETPTRIGNGVSGLTLESYSSGINPKGEKFGSSVALRDRNTLFVSAPGWQRRVNGVLDASPQGTQGNVYILRYTDGGGWRSETGERLDSSHSKWGRDNPGLPATALSISGDTLAIGTPTRPGRGSVFTIKDTNGNGWQDDTAHMLDDAPATGTDFGQSVAVSGDTLVVGLPEWNNKKGGVYIYRDTDNDGDWSDETAKVIQNGTGGLSLPNDSYFGNSVALRGPLLIVGADNKGFVFTDTDRDGDWTDVGGSHWAALSDITNGYKGLAFSGDRLMTNATDAIKLITRQGTFSTTLTSDEVKSLFSSVANIQKEVTVEVTLEDVAGNTDTSTTTLFYDTAPPVVSYPPPSGPLFVNTPITDEIAPSTADSDYRFVEKPGHLLPPGLSLNPNTGAITGTPTTIDPEPPTTIIVVTDAAGNTAEVSITFSVRRPSVPIPDTTNPTVTFSPTNNAIVSNNTINITLKFDESVRLAARFSTDPGNPDPITLDNAHTLVTLTESVTESGSGIDLATQLTTTFNPNSNTIIINPDLNLTDGTYTTTLLANRVADTSGNLVSVDLQKATFIVDTTDPSFDPSLSYTKPLTLTVGTLITPMSPTITEANPKSSGGYTLKTGHSLPPGLLLNTNTGAITGTPTTVNIQTRTIIVVTDAAGNTGEHPIIFPAVDAAPVSPPAATAPGVPQNFTATPGDGEVTLSWSAPTSDGGAAITKYQYAQKTGNNAYSAYADIPGSNGATTSYTFTSLTNNVVIWL